MSLIVLGNSSLAAYPEGGGHWTVFLQYLLGLKALGHDVLLIELLRSSGNSDLDTKLTRAFFERLKDYSLADHSALLLHDKLLSAPALEQTIAHGKSRSEVSEIIRSADMLWNFCAAFRQPMLSLFKRRVFIDLDPGHLQISALTWDMNFAEHDVFLTIGLKMNDADCEVPKLGLDWQTFTPFVYLQFWKAAPNPDPRAPFTSITHWTWDELWLENRRLSLSKREAYLRYIDLPERTGQRFQLAANIHPQDNTGDRELLQSHGWEVVHPYDVASSPEAYGRFIHNSGAEICCPKPIFCELRTGWLSDRSACYLASGRPVLAEDTGVSDHLPTGQGLVVFHDFNEAVAGVDEIHAHYERHSRAARTFAEEHLDSRRSLNKMLALCGG